MSDASADPDLSELLADLTRELRRLQREVEPDRRSRSRRRSVGRDLARFTSEVAIPGLILLLRTNIRALELLRRAIRLAEGREPQSSSPSSMRQRAETLGSVTLSQVDTVLGELQSAVEERRDDERAQELIAEARTLREQIQSELDTDGEEVDAVDIDVEAELRALKDDIENGDESDDGPASGHDDTGDQ
jgi:hypothetical protein